MSDTGIVTEWIELAVGDGVLSAYVARPDGPGEYPGVVVGHEIYGQHESLLAVTERLAGLGVIAILPDLFHRAAPRERLEWNAEGRERGLALLRTLTRSDVVADVTACLGELHRRAATSVHMVGFSAGGHAAVYAATQLPFATVTAFSPGWLTNTDVPLSTPEPTIESAATITGKLVLILGSQDPLVDADARAVIANSLAEQRVNHEILIYDAPHSFTLPGRPAYREEYAEETWSKLEALLHP
ncbi:dienelactone hydrolase family protein [Nocardia huaxiensis]|uniref:Dienelactone hydrolase family protein n=1 Tax=Nocardia huaxiensis TaxID=2755382 RepID=A0A7D6ZLL6_9NOCA|nr:dienelactone hydrolase family protein [Nocardia huaxiensis]QLY30303.1 dienelactone hydrolase family protein [Nocardia huaxiensis]UFS96065.1 dienelactone hydrolase family protein [Nocardia huaxiensis]